jgi:hypothetical protein
MSRLDELIHPDITDVAREAIAGFCNCCRRPERTEDMKCICSDLIIEARRSLIFPR